jgi:hypothetical protein
MKNYKLIAMWCAACLHCAPSELYLLFNSNKELAITEIREIHKDLAEYPPLNRLEEGIAKMYQDQYSFVGADIVAVQIQAVQDDGQTKEVVLHGPEEYAMHHVQIGDHAFIYVPKKQGERDLTEAETREILAYKIGPVAPNLPITSYQKTVREFDDPQPRTLIVLGQHLFELQLQENETQLTPEDINCIHKHWSHNLETGGKLHPINSVFRLEQEEVDNLSNGFEILKSLCDIPELQPRTRAIFVFNSINHLLTPKGLKDILKIIIDYMDKNSPISAQLNKILEADCKTCSEMLQMIGSQLKQA